MNLALLGINGVPLGKRNIKDPRLDQAHQLVAADKKTYAQVDLVSAEQLLVSDAVLVSRETFPDLLLQDLEFVETRLGRSPPPAEQAVLAKISAALESERAVSAIELSAEEKQAVSAHNFHTNRPIIVAEAPELEQDLEALFVRAFRESGYICFLTVGGMENRAWPIRRGATAWDAAGAIHTSIQKGFIRAEIISFDDFIQAGGETQAKRAGKLRLEQKPYVMQDYDLTNFRSNK